MHKVVVGLGYGDEGKGTVVDRLCATGNYSTVVRFNGGCQAAHNVITDDGRHHTFAQFGSGTLQGVPTYLSEFMMVEPFALLNEAEGLKKIGVFNPLSAITINPKCLVTTPFHWLLNRAREDERGESRHGSCGRGVGATAEYALDEPYPLRIEDLMYVHVTERKLLRMDKWVRKQGFIVPGIDIKDLADRYCEFAQSVQIGVVHDFDSAVFEGSQGVLLDEHVGFHPYTTWSTVTPDNVWKMIPRHEAQVIGVTRTYMTRHGAGPFVTEDNSLNLPETHNGTGEYQGAWRVGHLDIPALDYAINACNGIDRLYVTHADVATDEMKMCVGYKKDDDIARRLHLCDRDDFGLREGQTKNIFEFRPVYALSSPSPDRVSMLLDVKLAGVGLGPKTSDGVWFNNG